MKTLPILPPDFSRLIRATGSPTTGLMAIGEAGGYWEWKSGYAFQGKSGRVFDTYLRMSSLNRDSIYTTNVVPYYLGTGDPDPTQAQIEEYRPLLLRVIETIQPKYILCLGRVASLWFLPKAKHSSFSLEVLHGLPFQWDNGSGIRAWILPAYHPAAGLRNPEVAGKVFYDIKQFSLYARGKLRPVAPTDVAPNPDYRLSKIVSINGYQPAVDTEGYAHDPYCVSYSNKSGAGEVVLAADIKPQRLPRVVFHHSMHDLPVLEAMGLTVEEFDDTILMARLLLLEPAGLKDLALRHCGMAMRGYDSVVGPHFRQAVVRYLRTANATDWGRPSETTRRNKKTGKWAIYKPKPVNGRIASILLDLDKRKPVDLAARWALIDPSLQAPIIEAQGPFPVSHPRLAPLEELVPYAVRDADATRRLQGKLWPMIEALELQEAYYTDLHAIPMFSRMQRNGMLIDPQHFKKLRPRVLGEMESTGKAWLKKWNRGQYFNLASGDEVADFLFKRLGLKPLKMTPGGKNKAPRPSVDENTLELLKDTHPSIPQYLAWKKKHTNLTFVDRIPKWMREDTHRIHPTINTQGTVTGRPSTADPNLLNIPARTDTGKEIRNGFVAPEGKKLLSLDFSQIELRIGAHLSKDKRMRRAFEKGEDLHQKTADELGIIRLIAKTINFGIFYGMSYMRLRSELLEAGIEKSEQECKEIIEDWFRLYSGVREWLESLFSEVRRRGFVRGLSGRIRYLPNIYLPADNPLCSEAKRHAGNFPIQEGNAYFTKRFMRRSWEWIKQNPEEGVEPILQIYDEILFEIPEDKEDVAPLLRRMMLADQSLLSVPIKADMAIGYRWGELG